jgi:microsomal dipeptidase-like Zn-dependent dipeptidase
MAAEYNRLGVVVDWAHASFNTTIAVLEAPDHCHSVHQAGLGPPRLG